MPLSATIGIRTFSQTIQKRFYDKDGDFDFSKLKEYIEKNNHGVEVSDKIIDLQRESYILIILSNKIDKPVLLKSIDELLDAGVDVNYFLKDYLNRFDRLNAPLGEIETDKKRADVESLYRHSLQFNHQEDTEYFQKSEQAKVAREQADKEQQESIFDSIKKATDESKKAKEEEKSKAEEVWKKVQEKSEPNKRFTSDTSDPNMKVYQLKIQPHEIFLFLLAVTYFAYSITTADSAHEITFQDFRTKFLDKGFVEKLIVVNKNLVRIVLNDNGKQQNGGGFDYFYFSIGSIENFEHKLQKAQDENGVAPDFRIPISYVQEGHFFKTLFQFLPTLLMIGGLFWITKKSAAGAAGGGPGGIFGVGKSKAKKFNIDTDVKIKFKDVAGMAEAKEEVMEFVEFLKNPSKYEKLGGQIPRGAILSGPPGTGKTLLAKATAGEAGVAFYSVSGSEFVEMFVGVGASRVRDLFKTARENAPSIVFVDEIDAIGKARNKGNFSGANDERENTLNQLLVEMDGFQSSDHVVVLAGTNRPDVLDKALMRPGRFDRHIEIDKPELEGRKEIYQVYLNKILLDISKDNKEAMEELGGKLAALTPGFTGADIANVVNEAALIAARHDDAAVTLNHFEQAIERVLAGLEKKSKVLSPHEKKVVAYHEAGHAVCGWYLEFADPLLKVSIIPRGQGALGYAQYLPPDIFLLSVDQLRDRMTMALGGRISEELHFDSVTSGASDDFKKVTGIAYNMVTKLGMSPKIGLLSYERKSENDLTKPFSEETGTLVDEEIYRIVDECAERCRSLLKEKAEDVEKVAQLLLKKEVLTRNDMIELLGPRPFKEKNDAFEKYLDPKNGPVVGSEKLA